MRRHADLARLDAVAIEPDEAGRRRSGLIGQDAIVRHGKVRLAKVAKVEQVLRHRFGLARQSFRRRVKLLSHEGRFADVQKISRRSVDGSRVRLQENLRVGRIERTDPDFTWPAGMPTVMNKKVWPSGKKAGHIPWMPGMAVGSPPSAGTFRRPALSRNRMMLAEPHAPVCQGLPPCCSSCRSAELCRRFA